MSTLTGEIFLNLLEQDEIWVTGDGRRMALDEMEGSHRRNVLILLERKHRGLGVGRHDALALGTRHGSGRTLLRHQRNGP